MSRVCCVLGRGLVVSVFEEPANYAREQAPSTGGDDALN